MTSLTLGYLVILIRNQWWCSSWWNRIKWFSLKQYQRQHHHYGHHHLHMRSLSPCASWKISGPSCGKPEAFTWSLAWSKLQTRRLGQQPPSEKPNISTSNWSMSLVGGRFTNQNLGNWIWEVYSWVYHWFRYPQHELRYGKAIWFILYVLKITKPLFGR